LGEDGTTMGERPLSGVHKTVGKKGEKKASPPLTSQAAGKKGNNHFRKGWIGLGGKKKLKGDHGGSEGGNSGFLELI